MFVIRGKQIVLQEKVMEPTTEELESIKTAGNCPKGGQHTLGKAKYDSNNLIDYPVRTRFCGKCEQKLWLLEDIL